MMPTSCVTSLCEIKFNRKDVKAMNVLMCRRLLSALYQVKIEANIEADKQQRDRQPFPEFIPDQFMVLYGIKSLAIKNINEFLYGVRVERYRKDEKKGLTEGEPFLMPFWKGSWHGVPVEERTPNEEFEFYIDMLDGISKTIGDEHTLGLKSIGAFWNMIGSMTQISVPVFVCLNTIKRMFEKSHKDLHDRLQRMILQTATQNQKAKAKIKDENDLPFPNYKRQYLGKPDLDSRGHLTLFQFLDLSVEGMLRQQEKDAEILTGIYKTWVKAAGGEESFDVFAGCIMNASPELPEKELFALYQTATSGENPDVPNFKSIEGILRRRKIEIQRKGGLEHVEALKIDDLKTMSTVTTLFTPGRRTPSPRPRSAKGSSPAKVDGAPAAATEPEPQAPAIGDTKATGVLALFAGVGSGGAGQGKWSKSIKSVKKLVGADSLIRSLMAAPEEEQEEEEVKPP